MLEEIKAAIKAIEEEEYVPHRHMTSATAMRTAREQYEKTGKAWVMTHCCGPIAYRP